MRLLWLSSLLLFAAACADDFRTPGKMDVRICGNGTLDAGEECDDGNDRTEACAYGDASCTVCDSTCRLVPGAVSFCGDGKLDSFNEGCDDGNAETEACGYGESCTVCDAACELRAVNRHCGDGVVDADGAERCDDGASNSDTEPDACRSDCKPPWCGDGVRDGNEACDPAVDERCRADCTAMVCGDGIVDPGEECDPASGADDRCHADCRLPACGDGLLDEGEGCDQAEWLPTALAGRGGGACAIAEGGAVRCFGGPEALRAVPEALGGGTRRLTVGDGWACAISGAGRLVCWGEEPVGPGHPVLSPPPGRFSSVAAGDAHACAVGDVGVISCWGRFDANSRPTLVGFQQVASGRGFTCGLHGGGGLYCWGSIAFGMDAVPAGSFREIAAGRNHACAVRQTEGRVVCWGDDRAGQLEAPDQPLHSLALGPDWSCGLDESGEAICWGAGAPGPLPAGPFGELASLDGAVCALHAAGIACAGPGAALLAINADAVPGACRSGCEAPACGDGVVDPGEDCDDGNAVDDGNGCSATCERVGSCGDGIVQPLLEACDPGAAFSPPGPYCDEYATSCAICGASCTWQPGLERRCGDSRLDPEEDCDDGAPLARFRTLSMGGNHACGLLEDGRVRCFGNEALDAPPAGDFVAVETGERFACALDRAGSITCWGSLASPPLDPPRVFVALDAGVEGACALDEGGAIVCWGGVAAPPGGTGWQQVSVARTSACALDAAGAIHCWGNVFGDPPAGTFTRIAVGVAQSCAIDSAGWLQCWGNAVAETIPRVRAVEVTSGVGQSCAIDRAGMVSCFGHAASAPTGSIVRGVTAAGEWACAIREDGLPRCWGPEVVQPPRNGSSQSCRANCSLPSCGDFTRDEGEDCDYGIGEGARNCDYEQTCTVCSNACTWIDGFLPYCGDGLVHSTYERCDDGVSGAAQIGRGDDFTCILQASSWLRCWGRDDAGQSSPPEGAFVALAVGARHACALDRAHLPICWGEGGSGQLQAPRRAFIELAAGRDFTCGTMPQGGIACWGDVPFTPPASGSWEQLGAGNRHLCARGPAGTIACWGADDAGQATPPAGSFDRIAIGARHGCALAGGTPVCWGDDGLGQAAPPAGIALSSAAPFTAGAARSCGHHAVDGSAICWGAPIAEPAPATAVDLLALARWGSDFACGTTAAGLACWGSPGLPAAAPPSFNSDEAPDACRSTCEPAYCGDGVVDSGEGCDDGNTAAGDGCSPTCAVE